MRAFVITLALVAGCSNSSAGTQLLPIGSPCASSAQCGTGKFFCDLDHPNGYCKKDCHADADCPAGSVCAGAGLISPGACHKSCTAASASTACRLGEGYVCKTLPTDASGPYCDVPEVGDGG